MNEQRHQKKLNQTQIKIKLLKISSIFLLLLLNFNSMSQDLAAGFKLWQSTGLDWTITKKVSIKYAQLFAFNANPANFQFTQGDIELLYKTGKHLTIGAGYKPSLYKTTNSYKFYNRLYSEFIFRHKMLSLPLKHTLTVDYNFPKLPKYRYRFIYSMNYYFKNEVLPFGMTPYLKGEIYYYLGGYNISYYDDLSALIIKQRPNDFHRFRIGGGITSKPFPNLRATIYYLWQLEFNTPFTTNRNINVPSLDKLSIKAPFNNYSVVGLELEFDIHSKERIKSKKPIKTDLDEN